MRRHEPAPYTPEDSDVWVCVGLWPCFALNDALELASAIGDRRDALLMWRAQNWKHFPVVLMEQSPHYRTGEAIDVRGVPWWLDFYEV